MTVLIQLPTVTAAIAGLSVPGVLIRDIDDIPLESDGRGHLIIPIPERFVTDLAGVDMTFGAGTALKDLNYTLNYRLLWNRVGAGDTTVIGGYAEMVQAAVDFIEAIMAISTLSGCVDIQIENVPAFGPVTDPAGIFYNGCDFALRVREFAQ